MFYTSSIFYFCIFVLSPKLSVPYALCSHYISTTFHRHPGLNTEETRAVPTSIVWIALISVHHVSVYVCVMYRVCVYMCTVHQPSSCPTAYKPSAAIMEDGPHCVKDKSGVCHRWEITVIYEVLSQQRQVNMHFGGLPAISPPFCIHKEKLAGIHCIFT